MTNKHKMWIRFSWLVLVFSLVIMPSTSIAATLQPQQLDPAVYLPALQNNSCSGVRSADIPIGTQLYGPTGATQPHFHLLQNTGSAWLRDSIYWESVEPTDSAPNQYNWGSVDGTLRAAKDNCINMIITIEGTPIWAVLDDNQDGRSPIKPASLTDFAEFVTALVERYDGDGISDAPSGIVVNHWEFYNEPDFGSVIGGHEGWGNHAQLYAQMLEAIYTPVHTANPNAKVLLGGIAYNLFDDADDGVGGLFVRDFFKNVLDAGGGDFFDIMNFHYYPFQHNRTVWTNTDASGLRQKYNSIKAMLDAHELDKPLMLTEVGWHSSTTNTNYPSTDEYQARRVLELLTQAMSVGSEVTIWWTFFDESQEFAYKTGLTTAGNTPTAKPSYATYQEAIRRLGNSEYIEATVEPTEQQDLEAYRFRDKSTNKTFFVAWLNPILPVNDVAVPTFNDGATQILNLPGNKATIYDKDGKLRQTVTDGADGDTNNSVTVTVGRSPIYIVIN